MQAGGAHLKKWPPPVSAPSITIIQRLPFETTGIHPNGAVSTTMAFSLIFDDFVPSLSFSSFSLISLFIRPFGHKRTGEGRTRVSAC
jgi:hypothetical protein